MQHATTGLLSPSLVKASQALAADQLLQILQLSIAIIVSIMVLAAPFRFRVFSPEAFSVLNLTCYFGTIVIQKKDHILSLQGISSMKKTSPRRKRVLLLLGWYSPSTEKGIVRYAREANWALDLQTLRTGVFPENRGFDGILGLLGGWGVRPELGEFVRRAVGVPVVDMHADLAATLPAGRVLTDNLAVGRLAAEHFLEREFKNCLFYCRSLSDWSANERLLGFSTRLAESGLRPDTLECYPRGFAKELTARHCVKQLTRYLADAPRPLAIFAENDDFALFALDACEQAGLRVPEEVALLGSGNNSLVVEFASVPLSSVDHDSVTRSYRAAQLLDRLMAGEPVPREPIRTPPKGVILRRSTDILAVADPGVAAALNEIRLHFSDVQLSPQDVADACGINLRTLNRGILKNLGRSVAAELRQVRLRHARQLLLTTDLTISEVAQQSGFANLLHFRRSFSRDSDASPRQWRTAHSAAAQPSVPDPAAANQE